MRWGMRFRIVAGITFLTGVGDFSIRTRRTSPAVRGSLEDRRRRMEEGGREGSASRVRKESDGSDGADESEVNDVDGMDVVDRSMGGFPVRSQEPE